MTDDVIERLRARIGDPEAWLAAGEIERLRKGWLDQAARDAAEIVRLELVIAEDKQALFDAGLLMGKQSKAYAERTTQVLLLLEEIHQAIHKGQDYEALEAIAKAMETLEAPA